MTNVRENLKQITEDIVNIKKRADEDIRSLEEQKKDVLKADQYDKAANEIRLAYDSYINVGFTKEQAWELVKLLITTKTK